MLNSVTDLPTRLGGFTTFARQLKGDEKGEAPIYLNALFRAFGHEGTQQAGATHEHRISKGSGAKGKNFADLLWPQRVLFEMKSRGVKLERHYDQAFDYWTHIVPHRPPYVVLCNFDEFWIYDFNQQLFDPVDKIQLADLPKRWSALAFLLPHEQKPLFENNRVEVTRKAAAKLAELFRALLKRGEDRARAQRFVLQLLVGLVSEDMGLLPDFILSRLIKECGEQKASTFDLIGGLFLQMNNQKPAPGGRFQGVPYFNGGLFADIDALDLSKHEITILEQASDFDWSMVKPEIFGTLFQASMDDGSESGRDERHAFGAHFTSEFDIQKVVGPTIVRPWRERMTKAWSKVGQLKEALRDLRLYRVLDPACGSGNFLYVAYRELKRLEREILLRLSEISKGEPLETAVSIHQFYGLDVMPFAVELAKVTLMLAKEQEVRESAKLEESDGLLVLEQPLPLDNLDKNIVCADALFTEWPKADAIVGNPPYLGSRYIANEHGYEYVNRLYARFPGVPKMADFCTHWFRIAHDALDEGGRAGLVGTNTIRQNEGREASLDHIVANGGTITEAVSTQVWSGDAAVHVSIVNWVKGPHSGRKLLQTQLGDNENDPWKLEEVDEIQPSLATGIDASSAIDLEANEKPKKVFVGQYPFHEGFMITPEQAAEWMMNEPKLAKCLRPYMIGRDLVELGKPSRWIIDFGQNDIFYARSFERAFEHVKASVMPDVLAHAEEEKAKTGKTTTRWTRVAERWWQFRDYQPGTINAVRSVPRYVACSRVTKRPIFEFIHSSINPDNALTAFPFADDYSYGILQSGLHFEWFKARCSTLKGDYRYTGDTVFNTFPWPQNPSKKQIGAVAAASLALRDLRHEIMKKMNYSLRDLYRTLEVPGANPLRDAQDKLDAAVRAAYGMTKSTDVLAFLLELNHACAAREKAGEAITPPGLPLPESEHAAFISNDCILPEIPDGSSDESRAAAAHFHSCIVQEQTASYK
ncbi:MAG: class I SAM-dependent DNA methyltransferase [Verrucomicrobiaceae bacterium]|nr:class I SAM-dependent DNA methyltransferase [Verrucomicrobiaceae bacterium]